MARLKCDKSYKTGKTQNEKLRCEQVRKISLDKNMISFLQLKTLQLKTLQYNISFLIYSLQY